MDVTYNILKNYKDEVLHLVGDNPSIEDFVSVVLDLSNIKYTFTLMNNMDQNRAEKIRQNSYVDLSQEEIDVIKEFESRC